MFDEVYGCAAKMSVFMWDQPLRHARAVYWLEEANASARAQ
jgi:hypothetical protein